MGLLAKTPCGKERKAGANKTGLKRRMTSNESSLSSPIHGSKRRKRKVLRGFLVHLGLEMSESIMPKKGRLTSLKKCPVLVGIEIKNTT